MRWTKVGLGTAKVFCENFLNIKLCQLTKYQDQNFTLPYIDGQERKKEGKSEVQKFDNFEDKRLFFGTTKNIFDNFLSFILIAKIKIEGTSFNCHNKISYIKNLMHTYFSP